MEKKSILQMARGAILERVDEVCGEVLANVMDPNTDPTKVRSIVITLNFKPSPDRATVNMETDAKCKLVTANRICTSFYVGIDRRTGEIQAVENLPQIPGQFDTEGDVEGMPVEFKVTGRKNA